MCNLRYFFSLIPCSRLILSVGLLIICGQVYAKSQILVVHSWHDILWDRLWEFGLSEELGDEHTLIRKDLDAMRLNPKELEQRTNEIWQYYLELSPDLVVLGDDVALKVLGPRLEGNIPVVYLGINHNPRIFFKDGRIPENITGILERPLYQRTVQLLVELLPFDTKKVLLLNDSPIDSGSVTDIKEIFRDSNSVTVGNIKIDLRIAETWEAWQASVKNAKKNGYGAIFFDSRYLLRDADNTYVEPEPGVVKWMAMYSPVPIFNFYEDSIGPALSTGGWVVSGIKIGKKAAEYIKRILAGEHPGMMPPYNFNEGEYIFSRTQIEKWNIRLPKDIQDNATFVEDMHHLYMFHCQQYPNSICFD